MTNRLHDQMSAFICMDFYYYFFLDFDQMSGTTNLSVLHPLAGGNEDQLPTEDDVSMHDFLFISNKQSDGAKFFHF